MFHTRKGSIKSLVIIVLAAIVAGGFFVYNKMGSVSEDTVKQVAAGTVKVATDKGMEVMEEKGMEAVEAGKQMIAEKAEEAKTQAMEAGKEAVEDAMDKAIIEGKDAVGNAVKEVGDKMTQETAGAPGVFEDYSAEKIAVNGGAVIDFAADWCPSCRAFEKDVAKNAANIPSGLAILRADYDEEKDLKKKYGVTQQHTFVQVDASGTLIAKWTGSPNLEQLLTKVQ